MDNAIKIGITSQANEDIVINLSDAHITIESYVGDDFSRIGLSLKDFERIVQIYNQLKK